MQTKRQTSNVKLPTLPMKLPVLISRILVGATFIVSGLIKANDPLGFSYKMQEYFAADVLNLTFFEPYSLHISVFICVAEVVLGIAVLLGIWINFTSWVLLLMIVFFTFLTFYSAYFNKVTDCGCFGDALKLTPWQSFSKDIVLLILTGIIFFQRKDMRKNLITDDLTIIPFALVLIAAFAGGVIGWWFPFFFSLVLLTALVVIKNTIHNTTAGEFLLVAIALVTTGWLSMHCYSHLPLRDFRPYSVGKNIKEQMIIPPGAQPDVYETILTYKNSTTGEEKDFKPDNYPWQDTTTWKWVKTNSKLVKKGYSPPVHDFNILDTDDNDATEAILSEPVLFLIIAHNINKSDEAIQPKLNKIVDDIFKGGFYVYGITSSGHNDVENFRHKHQNMFDYFSADDTMLRTMIRSNPGLILLKQGTVVAMWHFNDLPEFEKIKEKYLKN